MIDKVIDNDRVVTARASREDDTLDRAVRPKVLSDYVGQPAVKQQMEVFIEAARRARKRSTTC